eukprot:TRINITY_DN8376_c0_g1_i1.p1 TRINITY_DN8376_c0_g1~~TRINITY_DN8376_c0_g1_i1.p1  ORF type:complete len:390 (+),score=165.31 TRINITY_DN8376_c0_g1_i1:261-1430(+)
MEAEDAQLADEAPEDIAEHDEIFAIDFHPSQDVLAVALITGEINMYRYAKQQPAAALHRLRTHTDACRSVQFSSDGRFLLSGSSDKSIRVTDVSTGQTVHTVADAHGSAVNVLARHGEWQLASGDDDGEVKLWDLRQPGQPAVCSWHEHSDFVSALLPHVASHQLISVSGDGRLGVYETRRGALQALSDEQDDELLSVASVKQGKKLVVGTQHGVLLLWSWGRWGDQSDRFPGHPMSVEQVVPLDDDTVVTASSDGLLRLVSLLPNKLLGVLGEHGEFPVELLKRSPDERWLASASHDQLVKFWDLNYLLVADKSSADAADADLMDADAAMADTPSDGKEEDLDDSSEDSDDDSDEDDDDSDSDDMADGQGGPARLQPRTKTNFFGGLL